MKKSYLFVLLAVLIVAIACGGGGGGGGTGVTDGSDGGFVTVRAEATQAGNTGHQVDATNIQVGQSITFVVAGYDSSNVRTILTSTNWTTTDNGNTVGTLSADGSFSATAASNSTFTATGSANGTTYSINYKVHPVQATATASLIDQNGAPAANVKVLFYNGANVVVASATSAFDGSLTASVPTSAVRFNIDPTTLPTSLYFKSYKLHGLRYSALITSCTAPLPALTNGVSTNIGAIIIDVLMTGGIVNPPPPPPDGCPTS